MGLTANTLLCPSSVMASTDHVNEQATLCSSETLLTQAAEEWIWLAAADP